jgi:hypothetical protein
MVNSDAESGVMAFLLSFSFRRYPAAYLMPLHLIDGMEIETLGLHLTS